MGEIKWDEVYYVKIDGKDEQVSLRKAKNLGLSENFLVMMTRDRNGHDRCDTVSVPWFLANAVEANSKPKVKKKIREEESYRPYGAENRFFDQILAPAPPARFFGEPRRGAEARGAVNPIRLEEVQRLNEVPPPPPPQEAAPQVLNLNNLRVENIWGNVVLADNGVRWAQPDNVARWFQDAEPAPVRAQPQQPWGWQQPAVVEVVPNPVEQVVQDAQNVEAPPAQIAAADVRVEENFFWDHDNFPFDDFRHQN